jgi:hypothetical protein
MAAPPEAASAHLMLANRSARLGRGACALSPMHGRHTVFAGQTTCMDAAQQAATSLNCDAR